MRRFEYNMTNIGVVNTDGLADHLDTLGAKGWKMVAITGNIIFLIREMDEEQGSLFKVGGMPNPSMTVQFELEAEQPKYDNTIPNLVCNDVNEAIFNIEQLIGYAFGFTAGEEARLSGFGHDDMTTIHNNSQKAVALIKKIFTTASPSKAGPAEGVFDYTYFMSPQLVRIKCNIINIMSIIQKCISNNVWFNFYPNTNNSDYPWLIVKKSMKERLAKQAEEYDMAIEIIPGQHMTEDKL